LDDPRLSENREPPLNAAPDAEPVDPAKHMKQNELYIKIMFAATIYLGVSSFFIRSTK